MRDEQESQFQVPSIQSLPVVGADPPPAPVTAYQDVQLADLLQEEDPFRAFGTVRLKVQRGDAVRVVSVPIRSVPQEVIDALNRRAPKPPTRLQQDPQSRVRVPIADVNDERYQEALQKHNELMSLSVVGHGVDMDNLVFRSGTPARTPEEKARVLRELGLSISHFVEIATAIINLTQWTEDERERHL